MLAIPLLLGAAAPTHAEKKVDPVHGWAAPSAREQAALDETRVPAGKGAIFVPAMTRGALEPVVVVMDQDRRASSGRTGERIVVDPGRYTVIMGSDETSRVLVHVDVRAGTTVIPPVRWGGLQVEVVDPKGLPHYAGYEVYSLTRRTSVGLGFGADTLQGESVRTWLLAPGVYRVVPPGGSMDAREEVASVTVPAGGLVRFRLVMDRDGSLVGGTVITVDEQESAARPVGPWRKTLAFGLEGSLSHAHQAVGVPDQLFVTGGAFVFGQAQYRRGWHVFTSTLEMEGGLAYFDSVENGALPLVKTRDRSRLELRYAFLVGQWLGPYVRGFTRTQLFPTDEIFPEAKTLLVRRSDGTSSVENIQSGSRFRTADALRPTVLQGAGGIGLNLLKRAAITLDVRAGVAYRYGVYAGTLSRRDDDATPLVEYAENDDGRQVGIEGTIEAQARLSGWLAYSTALEYFGQFTDLEQPVLEWRNMFTVRLSRHFSLNYNVNLIREPLLTDDLQLQQSLQLRASIDVF